MKETFNSESHGEGSFSFKDLQQQKHFRLKFRMLSTQINDHLFPKVTAETTVVQSKGFTKQRKHYKMPQEASKLVGAQSTQDPAWQKYSSCSCLGGSQRPVLKAATAGAGAREGCAQRIAIPPWE